MTRNRYLQHAEYYADKMGLRVFPCEVKGKRPVTPNGCKDATADVGQLRAWWDGASAYNVAIATGGGIVVLDVDINHDAGKYGDETLADLESQYEPLPDTWMCLTGGGGVHYYFACDDPALTVAAGFADGLDYRGTGGYVIAPPSVHQSGRAYEWEASHTPTNCELAPLPDWLHALMLRGRKPVAASAVQAAPDQVQEGKRNEEMFRLAASLRAKGLTVEEITAALLKANETRCNPPLAPAEIEAICKSAGRYERGSTPADDGSTVKPPDFSDAGNAEVFSRIYKDELIFVDALGWLWWNGKKWERDDHMALVCALALSRRMLQEASTQNRTALLTYAEAKAKFEETGDPADGETVKAADSARQNAKSYLTHARALRGAPRLRNMVDLSKPALVIKADKLDANPIELNTPAGIVNLTTGQTRPSDRAAYCSQITAASIGSKGADTWAKFLDTTTCGDGSLRGFLQLVSGMALIGKVYNEGIVIAYGGGRNGKSTFFNALAQVLGDYSGGIDIKTLTTDRGNKGASLATLRGKRLVVTGELEEHQRLSVATLKQVASTDMLTIEEKYKAPETVKQTHTLVLFTNHLPRVGSTDSGTWRRLLVVPFNATIPDGAGVQNYADVLAKEAGGAILAWAVEGAQNFIRNGFKLDVPDIVAEVTDEYRQREDWLNNFISERCIKDPNAREGARALYLAYREWAQDSGEFIRRENDFAAAMEAAGFRKIAPRNKRTWIGLRLDLAQTYGNPYVDSV